MAGHGVALLDGMVAWQNIKRRRPARHQACVAAETSGLKTSMKSQKENLNTIMSVA